MIHFSALGSSQLSWTIRVARRIPVILASIALLSVASIPVTESGTVLLSSAAASPAPPPNLSPMNIRFVPAEFATHYSATVPAKDTVTFEWSLTPPSVDAACNNHGLLTSHTNEFIWHHPDLLNSNPPGWYNCNHRVEGPEGHLGTVAVTITGYISSQGNQTAAWRCRASYLGTNAPDGAANYSTPFTCMSLDGAVAPTVKSASAPIGAVALGAAILLGVGFILFARRRTKDDCEELRRRCEELSAEARAAHTRAQQAAHERSAAQAALASAEAAVASAEHAVNVLDGTDQSTSWVEDRETGRRITELDLALQRADESASGHVNDYTPEYQTALRQRASCQAHAALDSARANQTRARSTFHTAASNADAADAAATQTQANADAACAAASECAERAAAPVDSSPPPASAPQAPGPVASSPPTPKPPAPATTISPVPLSPPPKTAEKRPTTPQCTEGDVRVRGDLEHHFDVELFVLALANIQVSHVYQMSDADVEEALAGFEKFKAVVDIAEAVEGFAGSAGDVVQGAVSLDTALSVFTIGVGAATNAFDPGATLEDSTIELLKEVIKRMNLVRAAGYYSMSCPLVNVHVSCTPTEKCGGGQWIAAKPQFVLTYGETVRVVTHDDPANALVLAGEVPRVIQKLHNYFAALNAQPLKRIRDAEAACAGGH